MHRRHYRGALCPHYAILCYYLRYRGCLFICLASLAILDLLLTQSFIFFDFSRACFSVCSLSFLLIIEKCHRRETARNINIIFCFNINKWDIMKFVCTNDSFDKYLEIFKTLDFFTRWLNFPSLQSFAIGIYFAEHEREKTFKRAALKWENLFVISNGIPSPSG